MSARKYTVSYRTVSITEFNNNCLYLNSNVVTARPIVSSSVVVIVTHAVIAAGVGRAFSRVCLFVCLSVCLRSKRKNGLSYQHQTWYTYTL